MKACPRLIHEDQLEEKKGIKLSKKQRKRLADQGLFPKLVPITARTGGYIEDEIDAYLAARIALRDAETA